MSSRIFIYQFLSTIIEALFYLMFLELSELFNSNSILLSTFLGSIFIHILFCKISLFFRLKICFALAKKSYLLGLDTTVLFYFENSAFFFNISMDFLALYNTSYLLGIFSLFFNGQLFVSLVLFIDRLLSKIYVLLVCLEIVYYIKKGL